MTPAPSPSLHSMASDAPSPSAIVAQTGTAKGNRMTVVALDAMGGDHAPEAIVAGAVQAALDPTLEIILVGRATELAALLPAPPPNLRLHDAPDAIGMAAQPAVAVRQHRRSSIVVGLELVKNGQADAFASFGNTGAVMAAGLFTLGRIPGVARPALATVFENGRGSQTMLLDVGANVDCRPEYLVQFALMGKAFVECVLHHGNPSIGLLNVGEEATKGNQFSQEAYRLLQRDEPNFIGNIEGGAMVAGAADIVVSDGFIGNIAIKMGEAMTTLVTTRLRRAVESKLRYLFGAWLLRGAFAALREHTDYQRVGGAPLIGINGAVVIGHGRADPEAVASGVRLARTMAESGYVDTVRHALLEAVPIVDPHTHDSAPTATRTAAAIAGPVTSSGD